MVGWIKLPLGKEIGLGPGHIVLDWDPVGTQPPTAAPPHFRPMPVVAKRSPISATAELLCEAPMHNIFRYAVRPIMLIKVYVHLHFPCRYLQLSVLCQDRNACRSTKCKFAKLPRQKNCQTAKGMGGSFRALHNQVVM